MRDGSPEDYQKYVASLLRRIPARDKAPDERYEARLRLCAACDQLNGGTCMGCGCLVELRAAYESQKCPYRRW